MRPRLSGMIASGPASPISPIAAPLANLIKVGDVTIWFVKAPPLANFCAVPKGPPLAQARVDCGQERWSEAAEGLLAVRDTAHGFGGSHAQRDIITLTLLDAAARAGRVGLATHMLNERCPDKAATPLTQHWRERVGAAA